MSQLAYYYIDVEAKKIFACFRNVINFFGINIRILVFYAISHWKLS